MSDESAIIEVEVGDERGGSLFFSPIGKRVRGRFDPAKLGTGADEVAKEIKGPVPGQVIGYDPATGEGYVREPLHDPRHEIIRERIARKWGIPPAKQTFRGDAPTWLFWLKRAVESGLARVVKGTIPTDVPGKPQTRFITSDQADPRDTLLDRMLSLLIAQLPADKRKAADDIFSDLQEGRR
jgi:hypothetical protein